MRNYGAVGVTVLSAVSMAASHSASVATPSTVDLAVHAFWTGSSAAGTLKLQVSCDNVHWVDAGDAYSATPSGAGAVAWNYPDYGFNFVNVVYTTTGGSVGNLTVLVNSKGV